jgi:putative NADPH-quinone reductase
MHILLIVAHPKQGSFNHALCERAQAALRASKHSVSLRDLYLEGFDPVMPAEELTGTPKDPKLSPYLAEVQSADGFVIVHPNWWGQPPAILKGWVDRVLRHGIAYDFPPDNDGSGVPRGLLKAWAAVILNTSNTPPDREEAVFGDPLERLWRTCIFQFCGVDAVHRRVFGPVAGSSEVQREEWLSEADALVSACFPCARRR